MPPTERIARLHVSRRFLTHVGTWAPADAKSPPPADAAVRYLMHARRFEWCGRRVGFG